MKNLKPFEAEPPTEKSNIPVILIETHHVIILRVKNPTRVWSKKEKVFLPKNEEIPYSTYILKPISQLISRTIEKPKI